MCTALENVDIPDSVGWLGQRCFKDCTHLQTVALPEGVEFIEEGMFEGCESLDVVVIPQSITHVESRAFAGTGLAVDDLALPAECAVAPDAFDSASSS